MKQQAITHDLPDFLVKSTLGCSLVSFLILVPFGINNFIQGRYILGGFTLTVAVLAAIDVWLCYQGQYNKKINLYLIAPSITVAIVFSVYTLGIVASYWPYLGVLSFYFILPEKHAWRMNVIFILIIVLLC